jgi:hypothetical protein
MAQLKRKQKPGKVAGKLKHSSILPKAGNAPQLQQCKSKSTPTATTDDRFVPSRRLRRVAPHERAVEWFGGYQGFIQNRAVTVLTARGGRGKSTTTPLEPLLGPETTSEPEAVLRAPSGEDEKKPSAKGTRACR